MEPFRVASVKKHEIPTVRCLHWTQGFGWIFKLKFFFIFFSFFWRWEAETSGKGWILCFWAPLAWVFLLFSVVHAAWVLPRCVVLYSLAYSRPSCQHPSLSSLWVDVLCEAAEMPEGRSRFCGGVFAGWMRSLAWEAAWDPLVSLFLQETGDISQMSEPPETGRSLRSKVTDNSASLANLMCDLCSH